MPIFCHQLTLDYYQKIIIEILVTTSIWIQFHQLIIQNTIKSFKNEYYPETN